MKSECCLKSELEKEWHKIHSSRAQHLRNTVSFVASELYQVIGALSSEAKCFDQKNVQNLLTQLSNLEDEPEDGFKSVLPFVIEKKMKCPKCNVEVQHPKEHWERYGKYYRCKKKVYRVYDE